MGEEATNEHEWARMNAGEFIAIDGWMAAHGGNTISLFIPHSCSYSCPFVASVFLSETLGGARVRCWEEPGCLRGESGTSEYLRTGV
jgi:hypothetical protein